MKRGHALAVAALPLLAACASHAHLCADEARTARMIEMQVDAGGRAVEIEYHVAPEDVPAAVRVAMDALHPGGRVAGAEKEYVGRDLYWELTKEIDGREVEAMFTPEGRLHSEEIEVEAARVPAAVRTAVSARLAGPVTKWEEIRDGGRTLVEYHAKLTAKGDRYKVRAAPDGTVIAVVREVPAEVEVPVP